MENARPGAKRRATHRADEPERLQVAVLRTEAGGGDARRQGWLERQCSLRIEDLHLDTGDAALRLRALDEVWDVRLRLGDPHVSIALVLDVLAQLGDELRIHVSAEEAEQRVVCRALLRDVDEAFVGGGGARAEEALLDQRDVDAGASQEVGDAETADSPTHHHHVRTVAACCRHAAPRRTSTACTGSRLPSADLVKA